MRWCRHTCLTLTQASLLTLLSPNPNPDPGKSPNPDPGESPNPDPGESPNLSPRLTLARIRCHKSEMNE